MATRLEGLCATRSQNWGTCAIPSGGVEAGMSSAHRPAVDGGAPGAPYELPPTSRATLSSPVRPEAAVPSPAGPNIFAAVGRGAQVGAPHEVPPMYGVPSVAGIDVSQAVGGGTQEGAPT